MDSPQVVDWAQQALQMALWLGAPALVAALLVGVVIGVLQTLTQLHEPVVGFVPRLVAVAVVVLGTLPWLCSTWVGYATELIRTLPERF
jgi:flagellar biosynthetic protein FliQ